MWKLESWHLSLTKERGSNNKGTATAKGHSCVHSLAWAPHAMRLWSELNLLLVTWTWGLSGWCLWFKGVRLEGVGATRTVLFPETTVSFASSCPCLVQCLQFKSNIWFPLICFHCIFIYYRYLFIFIYQSCANFFCPCVNENIEDSFGGSWNNRVRHSMTALCVVM